MKIYVACLASYNSGVLHGKWIDATTDVDEMQTEIAAILRASPFPNVMVTCPDCEGAGDDGYPVMGQVGQCVTCKGKGSVASAEEWAIHDYENMPRNLGEYSSLQTVAAYVELVEHIGDQDLAEALYEDSMDAEDAKSRYDDNYIGIYSSFQDYADEAADDMLAAYEVPDIIRNYFDYEAFARDLRCSRVVLDVPNGEAVFYA